MVIVVIVVIVVIIMVITWPSIKSVRKEILGNLATMPGRMGQTVADFMISRNLQSPCYYYMILTNCSSTDYL